MKKPTIYVLGFLFSPDYKKLVLIQKNKPEWQKGLFNVPGGRVENYDKTYNHATAREFSEEAGICIPYYEWQQFASLNGPDYKVYCFVADSGIYKQVSSRTSETIKVHEVEDVLTGKLPIVPGLTYLIPLARDYLVNPSSPKYTSFTY